MKTGKIRVSPLEEKMILSRTLIPLCALVMAAPLIGCTVHESVGVRPVGAEVVVRDAPPPEVVEVAPARREGFVWVRGHQTWNGARYVWVEGHWDRRPGGWVWVEGYWR
jgi:hypothetical protein